MNLTSIISTVIECAIHQNRDASSCVGPSVYAFFKVEKIIACSKTYRCASKLLCRRCGRTLLKRILACPSIDLTLYKQKQCRMYKSIHWDHRCVSLCLPNTFNHLCHYHTCHVCHVEAQRDLEILVWAILCLKRMRVCKDMIGCIVKYLRPVFFLNWDKSMHLTRFEIYPGYAKHET